MTTPASKNPFEHLSVSDIRGISLLATRATVNVSHIAEGVHQSVRGSMGFSAGAEPDKAGGISGLIYTTVRGVSQLLGHGLERMLRRLESIGSNRDSQSRETPQRQVVMAALNGVMGDQLVADKNPLAVPMSLHTREGALIGQEFSAEQAVTGKVLLLVHGLCLSDQQWRRNEAEGLTGHGEVLADALGYTPVYLRYNTGLHTSTNGRELSEQLSGLLNDWPVPVEELSVVAHSMGGLVVRSAADHALKLDRAWLKQLQNLVFLGTPHHGAPLERIGHWLHLALDKMPYTRPFTRLGRLRSAGITDLRFGHVQDEDWQGLDLHENRPDSRQPVPLPEDVTCFTIAATLAEERSLLADRLLGDGLVPLYSALGHHDEDHHALGFPPVAQRIFYSMGHLELLHQTRVSDQLLHWLTPESSSA